MYYSVASEQEFRHTWRLSGSSSVCWQGQESAAHCVVSCLAHTIAKRFENLGERAEGVLEVLCEKRETEARLKCLR